MREITLSVLTLLVVFMSVLGAMKGRVRPASPPQGKKPGQRGGWVGADLYLQHHLMESRVVKSRVD